MRELRGKQQTWASVLLCLFHTADTNRTKLSCLVLSVSAVWTEVAIRPDNFVLSRPSFQFATVRSQIYWGLLKTVLSCRQFSSHTDTCPCRRCEIGINRILQGSIICVYNNWRSCTNSPTLLTGTGASVPIQGGHRLCPLKNRGNQQLYYLVAL